MTREEAIKYLINPVATSTAIGEEKQKEFEAYNMAIEALTHDSDRISRQWLLDLYGDYIGDNGEPKYHVPLEVVRQNIIDAPSAEVVHIHNDGTLEVKVPNAQKVGGTVSNIEKYPKCHMRTSLGNCDPIGGFCTSVKTVICEALHKAADRPSGEWRYLHGSIGSYMTIHCPFCGKTFLRKNI